MSSLTEREGDAAHRIALAWAIQQRDPDTLSDRARLVLQRARELQETYESGRFQGPGEVASAYVAGELGWVPNGGEPRGL